MSLWWHLDQNSHEEKTTLPAYELAVFPVVIASLLFRVEVVSIETSTVHECFGSELIYWILVNYADEPSSSDNLGVAHPSK